MIPKFALIILLPIICEGRIQINITVASSKQDAVVKTSGVDDKLVTEHEKDLFNVTLPNLNYALRIYLGRIPDGVYLRDPTPYGNLFKKFKWPEVRRSVTVHKVFVDEVITRRVVLKTHAHDNFSPEDVLSNRSLKAHVENLAFSSWSSKGLPKEDIKYDIIVNMHKDTFKYENKWRERSVKSDYREFGVNENKTLTIKPGQGVIKKLTALRTIFTVQVEYVAKLNGNLIADFEKLYGKYHFYSPTVNNIMAFGNLNNEIRTTEKIEVRCYIDPRLTIYDRNSGDIIKVRRGGIQLVGKYLN